MTELQPVRLAIIGGTGVYDPNMLANVVEEEITTVYGVTRVRIGNYGKHRVAFMNRHGAGHSVPPHLVNYRANIAALKKLGVERVIATTAVGSCNPDMKPGDFVFIDQFIDKTYGRAHTFFEGGEAGVVHVDFTEPYCPEVRGALKAAAEDLNLRYHFNGTYVCTQGPRFETPAEIKAFGMVGGDLVGMTNVPEVTLAREANLCYATVSMVTNMAAGISTANLTHEEVLEIMAENGENLKKLVMATLGQIPAHRGCGCGSAANQQILG